jgi:nucleoside 2-deoxyribosyltransferase
MLLDGRDFSPLDNEIVADEPSEMARQIREANLDLIRRADAVIANLEPFRGFEPDSGTVFEIGYARALGKQVIGYAADIRPMKTRLCEHLKLDTTASYDPEGLMIEEFGLSHNLMFGELVRARSACEALVMLDREGPSSR